MCLPGVWLRPNQDTMDRIRATSAALKSPYYRTAVTLSRGRKDGHNQWQMNCVKDVGAQKKEEQRNAATTLDTEQMAERRNFPSFSGGDRAD